MQYIRLIVTLALCGSAFAWADVGMITQVNGDVSITTGGNTHAVVPYVKVNTGDKLTLAQGARLQLVYFGNGRQEVWKDQGQVEVGSLDSKSANKPDIAQLPPLVALQLSKMAVTGQQGKAGMVRMRSMGASEALDRQYGDLKRNSPADDTTPEVYLLSGLIEIKDYKRARSILAELDGKAGYKPLVDHFSAIVNAVGK